MFRNIRRVLDLLASFQAIDGGFDTPEGLRRLLEWVVEAADLLEVPDAILVKLREALNDQLTFDLILAAVRFAYGHLAPRPSALGTLSAGDKVFIDMGDAAREFEAAALIEWLPIVAQLIAFIEELRRLFAARG